MRHPTILQFAQKAFIAEAGRLLLVQKSHADPEVPGFWEVPGGRLALDQPLDNHLKREVFEEVGLDVTPGPPFAIWDWAMAGRGPDTGQTIRVVAVARVCAVLGGKLTDRHRTADDFLGEGRWVPLAATEDYDLIPSLRPAFRAFLQLCGGGAQRCASSYRG